MFKLKRLTFRDEKLIGRCGSMLLSGILALGGYMANADVVFSPTSRSFGAEGGSYRISVSAEEGTDMDGYWSASPMVSWIKLKSSSGHFAGHGRGSSNDFLETDYARRVALDVQYVLNWSVPVDGHLDPLPYGRRSLPDARCAVERGE